MTLRQIRPNLRGGACLVSGSVRLGTSQKGDLRYVAIGASHRHAPGQGHRRTHQFETQGRQLRQGTQRTADAIRVRTSRANAAGSPGGVPVLRSNISGSAS